MSFGGSHENFPAFNICVYIHSVLKSFKAFVLSQRLSLLNPGIIKPGVCWGCLCNISQLYRLANLVRGRSKYGHLSPPCLRPDIKVATFLCQELMTKATVQDIKLAFWWKWDVWSFSSWLPNKLFTYVQKRRRWSSHSLFSQVNIKVVRTFVHIIAQVITNIWMFIWKLYANNIIYVHVDLQINYFFTMYCETT